MQRQNNYCAVPISPNEIVGLCENVQTDAGSSSKLIPYTWGIIVILTNSAGIYFAYGTASAVDHNN